MPMAPASYRPPPGALTGRGLWMIRKLTDRMRIETGPAGTTVTVATAIDR